MDTIWELEEAKKEIDEGAVPDNLSRLLQSAINEIKTLGELKHVNIRFEDETLTLRELIDRYKHYRYGEERNKM